MDLRERTLKFVEDTPMTELMADIMRKNIDEFLEDSENVLKMTLLYFNCVNTYDDLDKFAFLTAIYKFVNKKHIEILENLSKEAENG
mgnify:CR=1 FL=1